MIVIDNLSAEPPEPVRGDLWRRGRVCCLSSRWPLLLCLLVLIYGSHAPLIALTQSDGRVPYSPSSCVVLIELTKLLVSTATLLATKGGSALCDAPVHWVLALPYAAPALLYALNNNLVVYMQAHMDPSTFQLLSNLKIVTTATLYSSCLGRRLRPVQWLALGLLTLAGGAHSYSSLDGEAQTGPEGHRGPRLHVTGPGLLLLLLYCAASGLAAVVTERALKGQRLPLSLQNIFLYSWGVAINVASHVAGVGEGRGFLEGFSALVWLIVIGQAAAGLMMSVVMKHGSGILRLFVISAAMLVNSAFSWALLGLQLTPLFLLPTGLVALAAYLYYR
ncbi:putative UDP-sugar transporter protein SLC35A4 [Alosa pseudoharengus]|uniref:putative UDP-sugar transporter protein SLC35A4 n=1 Tax=Alosa pseudoharengus TaxID=34774 RepID=UPI003F8AB319